MLPTFIRYGRAATQLHELSSFHSKGKLQGSSGFGFEDRYAKIEVQRLYHHGIDISYRTLQFYRNAQCSIREVNTDIRLEAVIVGELPTIDDIGKQTILYAGQYQFSSRQEVTTMFKRDTGCHYFTIHYSREFLHQIGVLNMVKSIGPTIMSKTMLDILHTIQHNPYRDPVRWMHYENGCRQLLMAHLTHNNRSLRPKSDSESLKKIYAADLLLQQDLETEDDIYMIARRVQLSETKLKRGFRQEFGMGVFERLTHHRMEFAKYLLQTTDEKIAFISSKVGYNSRTSFTAAFTKHFNISPNTWRKENS